MYTHALPPSYALLPLPGMLIPQISTWLVPTPSSGIYLNIIVSVSVFLISLKKHFKLFSHSFYHLSLLYFSSWN